MQSRGDSAVGLDMLTRIKGFDDQSLPHQTPLTMHQQQQQLHQQQDPHHSYQRCFLQPAEIYEHIAEAGAS